ncbi:P-loop containing nucleoside triphosphate hydrolase protein [Daedalea quercina L-15889]|uniref:p-loop containing nucleoside triphosphate hydrolase protein n=1 Tax=Daedalea quercina L-15889 TaxID=1314783 RepID=A0A165TZF7_9APHY|nr:P-loop containing nucleoside triphosphate hydrolase protein [Daedalea quercina L-15889]
MVLRVSGSMEHRKVIAVIGPTGVGKTTFINHVCDAQLVVGDSLESCTKNVSHACWRTDGKEIILVDTPGFDDTHASQADVLHDIGHFLKRIYESGITLTGIIYMYRISDIRFSGIARQNFRLFENICGNSAMTSALIVTTMWETVVEDIGRAREKELADNFKFFKSAINNGARMVRHYNNAESARSIVRSLLDTPARVLQMQIELVDDKKEIDETTAARVLMDMLQWKANRAQREIQDLEMQMNAEGGGADNGEGPDRDRLKRRLGVSNEISKQIKMEQEKVRTQDKGGGIFRFLRGRKNRKDYRVLDCLQLLDLLGLT